MPASPLPLLRYVLADNLDAAIEAGLMDYRVCPEHAHLDPNYPHLPELLQQAQRRLAQAWAARERYRARQARLQRRAAQRQLQRASMAIAKVASKPTLPTAAAAILARAKARAAASHSTSA